MAFAFSAYTNHWHFFISLLAGAGRYLSPQGLLQRVTSGQDLLSLENTEAHPPPPQDGSLLAEKHKANVSSGSLGIFSAKSPVSLERNPRLAGREEEEAGARVAASQLLPLTLCSRSLLAVTPASERKGSGKPSVGVRVLFIPPLLILFSTYGTLLQDLPGILALQPLPILVASVQVAPRPPLSFLLPSPAENK